MGVYLETDDGKQISLASNVGWSLMGDWIDTLDHDEYPELVHLWDHGWTEPTSGVSDQLKRALTDQPPDEPDAAKTAEELLATLSQIDGDSAVTVDSGLSE